MEPFKHGGECKKISHIVIHHKNGLAGKDVFAVADVFNDPLLGRRKGLVIDVEVRHRLLKEMFDRMGTFRDNRIRVLPHGVQLCLAEVACRVHD